MARSFRGGGLCHLVPRRDGGVSYDQHRSVRRYDVRVRQGGTMLPMSLARTEHSKFTRRQNLHYEAVLPEIQGGVTLRSSG